jgi:integrase
LELIAYNPAERIEAPRAPSGQRVTLDHEHVMALLEAASGHPYEAAIVLAVLHGLRVGEVLELTWGNCDLRQGVVTVRRQLVEDRHTGKRELAKVKTEAGQREVPLSGRAVAALERHRARLGALCASRTPRNSCLRPREARL